MGIYRVKRSTGYKTVIPRSGEALALPSDQQYVIRSAGSTGGPMSQAVSIRLPVSKKGYHVNYAR